ncbi:MAG: hypothetical protein ACJ8AW_19835 [Rhodopila sp.]
MLSIGNNQVNPDVQKASAADLIARLDTQVAAFNAFLAGNTAIPPPLAQRLREEMAGYVTRLRETASFAAYDASYGELLASTADERFAHLGADLDALVQLLADRRAVLTAQAITASLNARELMLGLGLGAAILGLLGQSPSDAASPRRCCA